MYLHTTITLMKIVFVRCLSLFIRRIMSGFFRKVGQELVSISASCGVWKMHLYFLQFSIKKYREREILQISEGQNMKTWTVKKRCFHRPCNLKMSPILRDSCLWKCHSSCLPRVTCEQCAELETLNLMLTSEWCRFSMVPDGNTSHYSGKSTSTPLFSSFISLSFPLEELKRMWHWCEFPPGPISHLNWYYRQPHSAGEASVGQISH